MLVTMISNQSASADDDVSLTPSETTLIPEQVDSKGEVRTDINGNPIKYQHDHWTNIMSDGSFTNAGANLLPPGYTDNSLVRIPIRIGKYLGPQSTDAQNPVHKPEKKTGSFTKWSWKKSTKAEDEIRVIGMSRGDYLRYWIKGPDGEFLPSVVEPPGGRAEWLRKQMVFDEELRKEDAAINAKHKREPSASFLSAVTAAASTL